jgi:hypothetical protein
MRLIALALLSAALTMHAQQTTPVVDGNATRSQSEPQGGLDALKKANEAKHADPSPSAAVQAQHDEENSPAVLRERFARLKAESQMYYERLKSLDDFQQYMARVQAMADLQKNYQTSAGAGRPFVPVKPQPKLEPGEKLPASRPAATAKGAPKE